MKAVYKLYVEEDLRLLNPVLYTVSGKNNELFYRVEGWDGNHGGGSEYRFFNGDFSDAGSAYRMLDGDGVSSYSMVFGMVVSGEPISYRVFLNEFHEEVRYYPNFTGGKYKVEGTSMYVDVLFQHSFWLYDGKKEIAKMKRKWFHFRKRYIVSVYDKSLSMDTIMGVFFGVLACIGDQTGRAQSHI